MLAALFSLTFWYVALAFFRVKGYVATPGSPAHFLPEIRVPPRKHHKPPTWAARRRDSPAQRSAPTTQNKRRSVLHSPPPLLLPMLRLAVTNGGLTRPRPLAGRHRLLLVRRTATALRMGRRLQQPPPLGGRDLMRKLSATTSWDLFWSYAAGMLIAWRSKSTLQILAGIQRYERLD